MQIKVAFQDYKPWSGAKHAYDFIVDKVGLCALEDALEQIFCIDGECPTDTEINDLLWFEPESVYEILGISEDEEQKESEDEEDED